MSTTAFFTTLQGLSCIFQKVYSFFINMKSNKTFSLLFEWYLGWLLRRSTHLMAVNMSYVRLKSLNLKIPSSNIRTYLGIFLSLSLAHTHTHTHTLSLSLSFLGPRFKFSSICAFTCVHDKWRGEEHWWKNWKLRNLSLQECFIFFSDLCHTDNFFDWTFR